MGNLGDLMVNVKANISHFSRKLSEAAGMVESFNANRLGKTVSEMREINKQTDAWGLNLKSVSRVVSGIVISQTFYRIVQSVREATNAVWEFSKQLEYAHIAYSNFFGDTALAEEFINVLKDFAAKTPFTFSEAEKSAKRLVAYGIEYKNLMYVMQGVLSAAAMQGDSAKIEQITRALGQISTYGKLMTAEVRQLTEAGIPVYDILQEKLGLTQEQLRNLGNEAIPASVAINALIDGMNERFGNVIKASSKTISGIISNIKDNAVMLAAGLSEPITVFLKSALNEVGEFLFMLREMYELKGAGGVFEAMFPKEMHGIIRQFVANLGALFQSVMRLAIGVAGLLRPAFEALMRVFNAFSPIVTAMLNALAFLVQVITSNATAMKILTAALAAAAAMWVVFKVKALATAVITAVINGISKSIAILSSMLTFVVAHPFWTLLIVMTGVLVGLSGGFGALSDKVNSFFKSLTQFNGVDPDKVLLPSQKDRANDLDKFNKKLDGTSDAMDDLADSTGKATKAAKGLLSFDEVFKLNEPDEGTDKGIEVPDFTDLLEGIEGIGDAYIPEIPDFSEYLDGLTGTFIAQYKEAWEGIKDKLAPIAGRVIGASFGALIGRLIGGPVGAAIGALAGVIVGYFWDKLAEYFGLTPEQKVNAGIIGGVGAVIGAILGGILGGPLGAKIGAAIGGFVGSFWGIFAEYLGVIPEQHFATLGSGLITGLAAALPGIISGIKGFFSSLVPTYIDDVFVGFSRAIGTGWKEALIGGLKQGVIGAIVGLATGMLTNAITGWIAKELDLTEQDLKNSSIGQTIGSILGAIIGTIVGGPLGTIVGGALGQLVGGLLGEFWAYISNFQKGIMLLGPVGGTIGLIMDIYEFFKKAFSGIIEVLSEAEPFISERFALIKDTITALFSGDLIDLTFFTNLGSSMLDALGPVGTVIRDVFTGLSTFFTDIKNAISTVMTDLWSAVSTVWNDISLAVTTVLTDLWSAVSTVWNDIASAVTTVCTDIWSVVQEIWYFIRDLTVKVVTDLWNAFLTWFTPIYDEVSRVCTNIWNTISKVFTDIFNKISQILQSIWNTVSTIFTNIWNTVKEKATAIWNTVTTIFTNIWNTIKTKVSGMWSTIKTYFANIYNSIKEPITNAYSSVKNVFSNMYSSVKNSISNMYTSVKDGIKNIYTTFTDWISNMWDNVFGKFFSWITDGIDKLREFFGLNEEASSISVPSSSPTSGGYNYGHATGGIFNREHVARFAEDNKAEAIIPLENNTAMQPFVTAVADGLTASLAPLLAGFAGNSQQALQPLYVGTLIADDRGLKELERKMEIIRLQEGKR